MEVFDAVNLAGGIDRERDAIKAAMANHAGEALWVVGFPHCPQDPVHDGFGAHGTFFQGHLARGGRKGKRERFIKLRVG